jgi:hypothetical protein
MNNDDFGVAFTSKPYSKYKYQAVLKGPKTAEKEPFLKAISRSNLNHLYRLNPFKKKQDIMYFIQQKLL